jgi:hypothetical protein
VAAEKRHAPRRLNGLICGETAKVFDLDTLSPPYNAGVRWVVTLLSLTLFAAATSADERRETVNRWLTELGNREAAVRSAARRELMGLQPSELPLLRELALAAKPLELEQVQALRDIVIYVKAREQILDPKPTSRAFLGLRWPPLLLANNFDDEELVDVGVPVLQRVAGFVVWRYLEEGDILLAMGRPDALELLRRRVDILNAVRGLQPGEMIEMRVLRGASIINVRFPIDSFPRVLDPEAVNTFAAKAEAAGRAYWDEQFAQLLPDEQS